MVLIIDDEKNIRESVAKYLQLEGVESKTAENGLSAQRMMEDAIFEAAIVDLKMPGMDGLEFLEWLRSDGPDVPVIMISAFGEIGDAVKAMKLGAEDYIVKPFDVAELALRLRRIIHEKKMRMQVEAGRRTNSGGIRLVGDSTSMKEIRTLIRRVSKTPSTILITGESGTGKEVIARAVHSESRPDGPFVAVNLGGIPESLLESELFGHEKGAFTGATGTKTGMFELASEGTLFLDEIGDMPSHLQVKILRVIQEKRIQRLGATRQIPVDTRIIAATNRDLEEDVRAGKFREDLFYRLNVVRIQIPPLRERPEDIPPLIGYLLRQLNPKMGTRVETLAPEALASAMKYPWPGNVRELENLVERALIFADSDTLTLPNLGITPSSHREIPEAKSLREVERDTIIHALYVWEGNRTKAAEELGITRRTLFNKIQEYGIEL
jgi:two-component system, NtrC family, response regulator AtoC